MGVQSGPDTPAETERRTQVETGENVQVISLDRTFSCLI